MVTVKAGQKVTNGPAAAALLASGIGSLVLGLMTTGAVVFHGLGGLLNWWNPAGPLTGKTGIAVLAWLVSWKVLSNRYREQDVDLGRILSVTLWLIVVGLLLTFPPVFELFE
ncbi:hypothetical protein [Limnochorda pilosa]|uniref:Uncharacterized protein n=1 Tax=Limnochorda pilosa TaxID=1555112 RepID=A0A0K2SIK1_LIMPI|nr:hypothetical protein [Limnochorda pilosa]BAS26920.1 hypothetical protein LIP_1063 [Limnochorda pilosa]